jgi:hypothetical protein
MLSAVEANSSFQSQKKNILNKIRSIHLQLTQALSGVINEQKDIKDAICEKANQKHLI